MATSRRTNRQRRRESAKDLSPRQWWHLKTGRDSIHVGGQPFQTRAAYESALAQYRAGEIKPTKVITRHVFQPGQEIPSPAWIKEEGKNEGTN